MQEESYEIKMSVTEFEYFKKFIADNKIISPELLRCANCSGNHFSIKFGKEQFRVIGDCLTEKLAKVGFDEKYQLTDEGFLIEKLIEKFLF